MSVDPTELESFVSDATRALSGEWGAAGDGVFLAKYPAACADAFGGVCDRRVTFDRDRFATSSDDSLEYVTTGAPLLAQLTAALRARGVLALAAGQATDAGPVAAEARLSAALRLRNGTVNVETVESRQERLFIFTFRVVFQSIERLEAIHGVAIDASGHATRFDPARLLGLTLDAPGGAGGDARPTADTGADVARAPSPSPGAAGGDARPTADTGADVARASSPTPGGAGDGWPTVEAVRGAHTKAVATVRAAVEPERQALVGKLADRREAEERQLTEYFRGLGAELIAQRAATASGKVRAEIGERLATIDRERDLRLAEVRERYEAKVDLTPVSLLIVEALRASAVLTLRGHGCVPDASLARRAPARAGSVNSSSPSPRRLECAAEAAHGEGREGGTARPSGAPFDSGSPDGGEPSLRAGGEGSRRAAPAALPGALRVTLDWIPLIDSVSLPSCPVCSQPVSEGALCEDASGVHLVCAKCVAFCPACGEARCVAHLHPCAVCSAKTCATHATACSAGHGECCPTHRVTCARCKREFCTVHVAPCAKCAAPSCESDRRSCVVCKKPFCAAHVDPCAECASATCEADRRVCGTCGKAFCSAHIAECIQCRSPVCGADKRFCAACRRPFCPAHVAVCDISGRPFCAAHGRRCSLCRQEYLAEAIRPDGCCKACGAIAPAAIDDPAVAMARHHPVLAGAGNWQTASTRTKYILTASTFLKRYRVIVSKTDGRILEAVETGKLFGGEKPLSV